MNYALNDSTLLQHGKYRIVRFLNSGGFGCTYEAEHTLLKSRVAIKEFFIRDFYDRDEDTNQVSIVTKSKIDLVAKLQNKFMAEARAVFQLQHPNIVRVTDVFEENGTAYYVMDFIDGQSLGEMVKHDGPLSEERALRYIRQVADALRYVHSKNRLHLDVKPGNIMVDKQQDKAILIDFGASKHYKEDSGEQTSTLLGVNTPGYAPAEQMSGNFDAFAPAVDIYALGATLYKLLCGITPPSAIDILTGNKELQPLPATVSGTTRQAITEAMQGKSKERPQSIDAFLALLDAAPKVKAKAKPQHKPAAPKPVEEDVEATVYERRAPQPEKPTPKQESQPVPKPKPIRKWVLRIAGLILIVCVLVEVFSAIYGNIRSHATPGEQAIDTLTVYQTDSLNTITEEKDSAATEETLPESVAKSAEEPVMEEPLPQTPKEWVAKGTAYQKKKNYAEALKCYQKAADLGSGEGLYKLGVMYSSGFGVKRNYATAVKWWRKAGELGHAETQYILGKVYSDTDGGHIVPEDWSEAIKWYKKAAEQGYTDAQYQLGWIYMDGLVVQRDYAEAAKWFKKADGLGHLGGQIWLGHLYEHGGYGIQKDLAEAKKWYQKASDLGYSDATRKLEELNNQLPN